VRLSADEADAIASHLGLEPRAFIEQYADVTSDRHSLTLIERADGACVMLAADNLCRINPVKPRQCRGFPERWRFPGFEAHCQARPRGSGGPE
jgi:Fe-S-cluster containining protein